MHPQTILPLGIPHSTQPESAEANTVIVVNIETVKSIQYHANIM